LLTRPFTFAGRALTVNYATSAVGSLRFELCAVAGNAYQSFAVAESEKLFGNEIAHRVLWRESSDVSALAGRSVRLRVRLVDADLFSFRFED
jgi:hypothetical protein